MTHRYDITVYYNVFKAPVAASVQPKAYLGAHSEPLSLPVSGRQIVASVPVTHVSSDNEKAKKRLLNSLSYQYCNADDFQSRVHLSERRSFITLLITLTVIDETQL